MVLLGLVERPALCRSLRLRGGIKMWPLLAYFETDHGQFRRGIGMGFVVAK